MNKMNQISSIKNIPAIAPLTTQSNNQIISPYLNELELILYCSDICYYLLRILNNDIILPNKNYALNLLEKEVIQLNQLLSKQDMLLHSSYTKKEIKAFFKKVGLKPKHLKTK